MKQTKESFNNNFIFDDEFNFYYLLLYFFIEGLLDEPTPEKINIQKTRPYVFNKKN